MKKIVLLALVALLFMPVEGLCKKIDKQKYLTEWANYEVSTVAVGQNGTKHLKVWGFGENVNKAIEQAKKNAVHACLFRGIPGSANARATPAIFSNQGNGQVAIDNFEYFYNFFEDAEEYLSFINVTTDGVPSGQDRREVKKGYKVGLYVQVMYDNLREKMKRDGILKQGSSGFSY